MSDAVRASELPGLNESESSLRSNRVFQELFAAAASTNNANVPNGLQDYRNLLVGLKLRHEAIVEDRITTETSAKAYSARISDLRQQLESKSRELEALKSKYQAEEKIVSLAQKSFEHPQWIDVGGEEVRMVLNRTQDDLIEDRKALEGEVAELEDVVQKEKQELKRRLDLTNTTLSTVSELRSKIEMPKEQREQIFGRDDDDDVEHASAEDDANNRIESTSDARPDKYASGAVHRDDVMIDEDNEVSA